MIRLVSFSVQTKYSSRESTQTEAILSSLREQLEQVYFPVAIDQLLRFFAVIFEKKQHDQRKDPTPFQIPDSRYVAQMLLTAWHDERDPFSRYLRQQLGDPGPSLLSAPDPAADPAPDQ